MKFWQHCHIDICLLPQWHWTASNILYAKQNQQSKWCELNTAAICSQSVAETALRRHQSSTSRDRTSCSIVRFIRNIAERESRSWMSKLHDAELTISELTNDVDLNKNMPSRRLFRRRLVFVPSEVLSNRHALKFAFSEKNKIIQPSNTILPHFCGYICMPTSACPSGKWCNTES